MDELYTFIGKKEVRAYVWTAVGVTKTGRKFYFYHLSYKKDANTYLHLILIYHKLINIIRTGILHMTMFMERKPLKRNQSLQIL
jgi:hypothetical protein